MNETVSVIVPVYNAERYLPRCLDSILIQTYHKIKVILVNDGSEDKSGELCERYAEKDERVSVINKPNGGQASARTAGLHLAAGDFIMFVDSDDYIRQDCVENMLALAVGNNAQIVQCSFETGYEDTFSAVPEEILKPTIRSAKEAINSFEYKVAFWGKLYRAELFSDFTMPDYARFEDDAAYYKIVYRAKTVCLTRQKLYYYYQSRDSVMRNGCPFDFELILRVYQERIEYFLNLNEERLVSGTHERLCLIMMLAFIDTVKKDRRSDTTERMLELFRENYGKIGSKRQMTAKNRTMFALFHRYPGFASQAVIKLGLR